MILPSLFDFGFSTILYLFLFYLIGVGGWQTYQLRVRRLPSGKSIVPLGAAALVVSVIAYLQKYREAFDAIQAAGDISPGLVAGAMRDALAYPTLGLLCLAVAFLFRYVNQ